MRKALEGTDRLNNSFPGTALLRLSTDNLTLDRIMAIFTADLRHRSVDFQVPSDPLVDTAWTRLLQRIYAGAIDSGGKQ